jgi:hypothetical protein
MSGCGISYPRRDDFYGYWTGMDIKLGDIWVCFMVHLSISGSPRSLPDLLYLVPPVHNET